MGLLMYFVSTFKKFQKFYCTHTNVLPKWPGGLKCSIQSVLVLPYTYGACRVSALIHAHDCTYLSSCSIPVRMYYIIVLISTAAYMYIKHSMRTLVRSAPRRPSFHIGPLSI
jgi:hypothetical protein